MMAQHDIQLMSALLWLARSKLNQWIDVYLQSHAGTIFWFWKWV